MDPCPSSPDADPVSLEATFEALRALLQHHEPALLVDTDEPGHYVLNEPCSDKKGRPVFFAMVKTGTRRVAFHLMPLYCRPELLEGISPELRKRMQGKSCFNFTRADPVLLDELAGLVLKSMPGPSAPPERGDV